MKLELKVKNKFEPPELFQQTYTSLDKSISGNLTFNKA